MKDLESAGKGQSAQVRAQDDSTPLDVNNRLGEALEEACDYLAASMCLLLLYDNVLDANGRETQWFRKAHALGISAQRALDFERLANSEPCSGYLAALADPVVSNIKATNGLAPFQDWASVNEVSSFALIPMVVGVHSRGILLFCSTSDRLYTDGDIRTLQLVGKMSALVLTSSHPQTKNRFISALSHELRTPLTSIIGFTQIIRKRLSNSPEKDERLLGQVDVLWSQAQRLSRLIDTYVDVSRLEDGPLSINPGRAEIVSILKKAVEQSLAQARSKHRIIYELPDHEVEVFADLRRIDQVFNQVLSNAIRFSPEHQPIEIRCEDSEVEGKVVVTVTDRGPGIPEARIKEVFERLATNEPLRAGGLGVGLYISRSIVEAHGGSMSLESSPEKGTTIRIELPR